MVLLSPKYHPLHHLICTYFPWMNDYRANKTLTLVRKFRKMEKVRRHRPKCNDEGNWSTGSSDGLIVTQLLDGPQKALSREFFLGI